MTISVPSLHRVVPVKFFHFVPGGEAQPQVLVHVRALVLLKLVLQTTLPVLPRARGSRSSSGSWSGQLRREALRLHQSLVVDHDELALVRPAVPLQEDPGALVAQQPQLRAAVGGRAVVGHLQLAPASPVLRQC